MNEDMEREIGQIAGEHAARYLEEFARPSDGDEYPKTMQQAILHGWVDVRRRFHVTGKGPANFELSYYGGFMTAFLRAIFPDKDISEATGMDVSLQTIN
jgi:hypothetical protein